MLMYNFLYNYVFKKWGVENVNVCETDTDSLILEIHTEDIYRDISTDIDEFFDTSNYERTNYNGFEILKKNKKVLGKMKDELGGRIKKEFVGVAPKNFSFIDKDDNKKAISKGIKKSYKPKFKGYKRALFEQEEINKENFRISSKMHNVYCLKQNKIALDGRNLSKRDWELTWENDEFKTYPFRS